MDLGSIVSSQRGIGRNRIRYILSTTDYFWWNEIRVMDYYSTCNILFNTL